MKKKNRKRKFVVWLNNHTDRRDDEWVAIWAKTSDEAKKLVAEKMEYDPFKNFNRFSLSHVYTAREFRKRMGFGA